MRIFQQQQKKAWLGTHTNGVLAPFIKGEYAALNDKQKASFKQISNPSNGLLFNTLLIE